MKRPVFLAALAVAACLAVLGWRSVQSSSVEVFSESKIKPPEPAPQCPWREPRSDLKMFFPRATSSHAETRILSGLRLELAGRLGRQPTGDENALRLNRVCEEETNVGTIITRRVKGEYGGIELVLATDNARRVRGVRVQRMREPQASAQTLVDTNWLKAFVGKQAADAWKLGRDVPDVPPTARQSAAAIVEGIHSMLVLLETSDQAQVPRLAEAHHH